MVRVGAPDAGLGGHRGTAAGPRRSRTARWRVTGIRACAAVGAHCAQGCWRRPCGPSPGRRSRSASGGRGDRAEAGFLAWPVVEQALHRRQLRRVGDAEAGPLSKDTAGSGRSHARSAPAAARSRAWRDRPRPRGLLRPPGARRTPCSVPAPRRPPQRACGARSAAEGSWNGGPRR